jgi:hypothetical protein
LVSDTRDATGLFLPELPEEDFLAPMRARDLNGAVHRPVDDLD